MSNLNKRKSNFELLRIVCMVMIVVLHTIGHGGGFKSINIYSNNFFYVNIIKSLTIVAVNCYILITGYFGINSTINLKKIRKIYIQVLFYSLVINGVFLLFKVKNITNYIILQTFFPITMKSWWFITNYLILCLIIPYINKLVKSLSFKEINKLLIILFGVFTLWSSLIIIGNPIDNSGGYSLYNFIYIYIIGAYINLYFQDKKINKKITLMIYLTSSFILSIFNVFISRIKGGDLTIYAYNFLPVFLSSIALFLFFKEVNIQNKLINKIASLTLGVYLIHDHPFLREYIYKFLGYERSFNNNSFFVYTIVVILTIYITSSIIEYFRQILFKQILKLKHNKFVNVNRIIE